MFCVKCGNKIKEGYKFCDKCGTKVKENTKSVDEKKNLESIENNIEEKKIDSKVEKNPKINQIDDKRIPVVNIENKKKSGKGKIIFLTILNILLLASTIVFLVLWLIKPSNKSCKTEESSFSNRILNDKKETNDTKDEKKEKESSIIGKWEQNVDYKQGNKIVKRTYGMIELKKDGTFNSVHYDKDNMSNSERINGTYTSGSNYAVLSYYGEDGEKESVTLYVNDGKMCIGSRTCDDYLIKNSYNNKIVIYQNDDSIDIDFIDYNDYQKILDNKENAIVVVVRNGCYYCEQYKSVVEQIHRNYLTSVYYYKLDDNLDVTGTPTTFVIKNGEVIDKIIGYYDYSRIDEKLKSNNVF